MTQPVLLLYAFLRLNQAKVIVKREICACKLSRLMVSYLQGPTSTLASWQNVTATKRLLLLFYYINIVFVLFTN